MRDIEDHKRANARPRADGAPLSFVVRPLHAIPGWSNRYFGSCRARCGRQFMSDQDLAWYAPHASFCLFCSEACARRFAGLAPEAEE